MSAPRKGDLESGEFLAGQNRILEMVATGQPVETVLADLCRLIEAIEPRAVVSVLILNRERRCFGRVVTPSLDPAYSTALVGAPIDPPHLGTCGAAVYFGKPVLSLDIASDERWSPIWRDICLGYGLQACQSTPILASDGTPLGSFLISFREPSMAETWNPKLIQVGTHLAGIVLERDAKDHALRQAVRDKDAALSMLEAMLDHAPVGFAFVDRGHRCVRINHFLARNYSGLSEADVGRSLEEVFPSAGSILSPEIDRVFETGQVVSGLELSCGPVQGGRKSHWLTSLYPVIQGGAVAWVGAILIDITERKRDEESRKLLLAELSHRVKNTLAVVQSIATQTLDGRTSAEEFARTLKGRIQALAVTHTLLSESSWTGAGLRAIAQAELAPYLGEASPRVAVEGPDLQLKPRAAQAFALAIHELATNAAKHGSLSVSGGSLDLRWSVDGEGEAAELELVWAEAGGPAVEPPRRTGFGHRLIARSFRHDLDGRSDLDFRSEGLIARFRVPLASTIATE